MSYSSLRGVLESARSASAHTTDLGDRFERLCVAALTAHPGPQGAGRFEEAWLWSGYPHADTPDIGIDVVARETEEWGGGLVAIQCKFYAGTVSTQDIDSFLAASGRPEFTSRILMHTGTGLQKHGASKIRHAHPRCEVFDLDMMGRWDVDWWEIAEDHHVVAPGSPRVKKRAKGGRGVVEACKDTAAAYRASWRKRWRSARFLLRVWLLAEGCAVVLLAAALLLTALALAVSFAILAALASMSSGKSKRRR